MICPPYSENKVVGQLFYKIFVFNDFFIQKIIDLLILYAYMPLQLRLLVLLYNILLFQVFIIEEVDLIIELIEIPAESLID